MKKNKQNISPAVIGAIGAGAAVTGGVATGAAQSFMDKHAEVVQSLHSNEPVLPDDVIEEPVVEAMVIDEDKPDAVGETQQYNPQTPSGSSVADDQHVSALEDDLLAVEAVDPHDVEADDLAEYGEVGVIESENGVMQNYAVFEMGDDQLAMVDLDGDGVFDIMADEYGNTMDMSDPDMPAFTVSDAEVQMQEQNGQYEYMAQTDLDNNTDTSISGDYYGNDMIDV